MAHNLAPLGAGHYRRPKSNSFLSPLNPSAQVAKRERGNTIDSPVSFKPPLPLHLQQQQQQMQQQQQQQMQQYQGQQNYQVQQQSNLPLTAVLQLRRNGTPKRGSKHHYWSLRSSGNTNTHFSIGLSLRNNVNQEVLDFCQNCLQPLPPLSPSSVSSPDLTCCARPLRGFVQNDCKIAGSVIECTGDCSLGSICEPLVHLSADEARSLSTVPFIPTSSSSSSSSSAAPALSSSPANASSLANGPGGVSPGSSVPGNSQEDPVQLSGLIPPTVEPGRILKLKVHQHVLVAVTVGLHHFAYDPTITRPSTQPAVTSFPTQRDVTPITINCCMMAKPDVKCGMVKFNNLIGPAVICTAKGISMEKLPASLCGPTTFAPTHPINAPNIAPQISSPSSAPSHSHSFLSPSSFHMGPPPPFQSGTPPSSFHFSQQLQQQQQQQQSNHANSNHLVHNNNNLTPQQQQHLMNMSNSNNQQSGFSSGVRTPPLSNSGGLSSSPFDSQNSNGNGNGNGTGFSNYLSSPFLLPQLIGSSSSSSSSTQSPSMFQQHHHQQQQQSGMFGSAPSQSFLRQPSTFQEAMMQRHEFSQPDSSFSSGDVFMQQQQQQHAQQQQQGQGDWMQDSFSQDDALYFPPAQHNMMDSSVIPHFNNGAGNNNNSGSIPINPNSLQAMIGQSGNNNNNGGSGQMPFARPFDHIKSENSWSDSMSRSAPATFSGPGLFDIMQHHQQQQQFQQQQQQQQFQQQQQQHQFQQHQHQQQQQPQFSMGFHRTMGNNNGGMGFQNPNANMGMGMNMGLGPGGFGQVTAGFERSTTPTNWSVASPTDSCASTADFEMGPGWNMEMDGGEQAYAANSSADQIDVNQYFNNSMDGGSSTEANYDSDGSSSVMAGPGSTSPFLSHNPTHHNNNSGNMPIGQGSPLHQNQNSAFGGPRFPFQ